MTAIRLNGAYVRKVKILGFRYTCSYIEITIIMMVSIKDGVEQKRRSRNEDHRACVMTDEIRRCQFLKN